ncbi:MAG: CBS domain-containing protein [Candidatus Thermoplasmatota archaeon]|nr:CBS domain-containing protein [Candidatus Thermoplasmatota archaeon]
MLVGEIMTKGVVSIDSNNTVLNACLKYRDKKIGCLIVTENEQCVGIVTERDIIERAVCQARDPEKTKIKEIMSSDIKSIHPLDNIEKAIEEMNKYKIKKLPVISDNSLVGIITIADIGRSKPELTERFMESWVKPRWTD